MSSFTLIKLILLSVFFFNLNFSQNKKEFNPISQDILTIDQNFPPAMLPIIFESSGSKLNGIIYLANGQGPHPTAILLHGYPGNEKNLDLAQTLRRAGLNVLFFHYRGSWGSEGSFSLSNCLEDIETAITTILKDDFAKNYRVDKSKIILIGHSMGGGLTLLTAAENPSIKHAISIAGANFAVSGKLAKQSEQVANQIAKALHGGTLPLRGTSGKKIVEEIIAKQDEFNLPNYSKELSKLKLLLIAGKRDNVVSIDSHHQPLVNALRKENADFNEVFLDADHSFSSTRIALSKSIIDWLIKQKIIMK